MKTQLIGILAVALLSGCANLSVKNFDESDYSLAQDNRSDVVLIQLDGKYLPRDSDNPTRDNRNKRIREHISENEELENVIDNNCISKEKEEIVRLPVINAASFAAPVGKLVFNWYMDKQIEQTEELKRAAQAEYSNRIITAPGEFNNATCAIIYRYGKKVNEGYEKGEEKETEGFNFVAVLKLEKPDAVDNDDQKGDNKKTPTTFVLKPIYVKAHNTVAITKSPDEGDTAKIDTSFTVSLKVIKHNATGLPALSRIGEGVVTVADVDVAPEGQGKASCNTPEVCESSDLIALPDKGDAVSVTFVTTETGKIDIDLDKKAERLKALKEALGPVLESELQKLVKQE